MTETRIGYGDVAIPEPRVEPDYRDIADDFLQFGEWNGKTLSDFEQWAFGKSEQYCNDVSRLCSLAMIGGNYKTESEEIGNRMFDLLVQYCRENDK